MICKIRFRQLIYQTFHQVCLWLISYTYGFLSKDVTYLYIYSFTQQQNVQIKQHNSACIIQHPINLILANIAYIVVILVIRILYARICDINFHIFLTYYIMMYSVLYPEKSIYIKVTHNNYVPHTGERFLRISKRLSKLRYEDLVGSVSFSLYFFIF